MKLDKTGPSATLAVTAGTPGANGWYTSDVTVGTSGADSISGPVTCTADQFQTSETMVRLQRLVHQRCRADDQRRTAHRQARQDRSVGRPGRHRRHAGPHGWYTSDVTVGTSGADPISGPVTCTADQFQTSETIGDGFNGWCTNDAGLTTDAAPLTVKLDKTGPSASLAVTAGTPARTAGTPAM